LGGFLLISGKNGDWALLGLLIPLSLVGKRSRAELKERSGCGATE
jgi:hypothetical protein